MVVGRFDGMLTFFRRSGGGGPGAPPARYTEVQGAEDPFKDICDTDTYGAECASEGNECVCLGTVRYGAGDKWKTKAGVTGKVACKKNSFGGDPAPGACQCR